MKVFPLLLAIATLAACAGPAPRYSANVLDRILEDAPHEAQPGKIVAVESAFARAAREEGQWTAFHEFAADGAVIHGRTGPTEAKPWLAAQEDPPEAVQWGPRAVWMSCDGELAVSRGRFLDPDGTVGTFVTVWQRQSDDSYKWIYDVGAPDDPQPAAADKPSADEIVVQGLELIQGHVADCESPRNGPLHGLALPLDMDGARQGGTTSRDGTLTWRWVQLPDGKRAFSSAILRDGSWQEAAVLDMPAA